MRKKKVSLDLSPKSFFLAAFFLFTSPFFLHAQEEMTCSLHIHSARSSGARSIPEIARVAQRQGIDAIVMTDLLVERYEYGLRPLHGIIKKTVKRNSIWDKGVQSYMDEIKKANEQFPSVAVLDGTVVTPYYYWSGDLLKNNLVLNDRAKDLIVFGFGDAEKYKTLPVIGNGKSKWNIYSGPQGSKPYQAAIDDAKQKGGIVLWSHAEAEEHAGFNIGFLGRVAMETRPYREDVINTRNYDGIGIYSSVLSQLPFPEFSGLASVGTEWDKVLSQHTRGLRDPVWVYGETDYTGFDNVDSHLSSVLNVAMVESKSTENLMKSFRDGSFYLAIPDQQASRRLVLKKFSAGDALQNTEALMGQTLESSGQVTLTVELEFSNQSKGTAHMLIIKDGRLIEEGDYELPGRWQLTDSPAPDSSGSFYRILVYTQGSERLLSNPVFLRRAR